MAPPVGAATSTRWPSGRRNVMVTRPVPPTAAQGSDDPPAVDRTSTATALGDSNASTSWSPAQGDATKPNSTVPSSPTLAGPKGENAFAGPAKSSLGASARTNARGSCPSMLKDHAGSGTTPRSVENDASSSCTRLILVSGASKTSPSARRAASSDSAKEETARPSKRAGLAGTSPGTTKFIERNAFFASSSGKPPAGGRTRESSSTIGRVAPSTGNVDHAARASRACSGISLARGGAAVPSSAMTRCVSSPRWTIAMLTTPRSAMTRAPLETIRRRRARVRSWISGLVTDWIPTPSPTLHGAKRFAVVAST
jgi:hypothetical protein